MGLRIKLFLIILTTILLVSVPLWVMTEHHLDKKLTASLDAHAVHATEIFRVIIEQQGKVNTSAIQEKAEALRESDETFRKIRYYVEDDGAVVTAASTDRREIGKPGKSRSAEPFTTKRVNIELGETIVEINEPLIIDGEVVGFIGVFMNLPYHTSFWNLIGTAALLASLAILVILYTALSYLILSPLKKLKAATAQVGEGQLSSRIRLNRNDEFGALSDRFNEMIGSLQQREEENQTLHIKLKERFNRAQLEAETDPFTGLLNRRSLEKHLKFALRDALDKKQNLACLFGDLDGFKTYNDVFGHQKGDVALKSIAAIIETYLRDQDTAARYGGEEFVLFLADTDLAGATVVAERIRRTVAKTYSSTDGKAPRLTISIGIAMLQPDTVSADSLIHHADQAMYAAKGSGKNLVMEYNSLENV